MRMSSAQIFQQGISAILAGQSKLSNTEQQLATGRRILTPSDDPVAALQILDITEDLKLVDQYQRNSNLAQGQLALEESALANVGNILQRTRELVLQANNASQSPETRNSIAVEIEARIDELQGLANKRDASGEYIFAGFQSQQEPFSRQGNTFSFNGDDNQRFLQTGASTQVAVRDSGFDIFMAIASGNGSFSASPDGANAGTAVIGSTSADSSFIRDDYSITFSQATTADPVTYQVLDSSLGLVAGGNYVSGSTIEFNGASIRFDGEPADSDTFSVASNVKQDIFTTMQNIVDRLKGAGAASAEVAVLNSEMGLALDNIDQALGNVLNVRADVGVRLNHVENQLDINESFNLQLQETLSGIQDLDYAEAISRFNLQLTTLQAAQQSYVKMQGLSLFNYL
jgi:flagellar hook-associated protein 3 FlgL